jgi:hypothetical protein
MASLAFQMEFWNRDELYEDVWKQTLTSLVAKYGVSAVAIGKTCRKLQVPLPGRGYWAKEAHGHAVTRKPLPKLHEIPRIVRYRPAVLHTVPTPPPKPEFPVEAEDKAELDRITQKLSTGALSVKNPRKALHHVLVVAARNSLRHASPYKGILQVPWNESCLDIRVSKPQLARALGIMAAVIAVLEDNGAKVRVTPGDRSYGDRLSQTIATIFGENIQFGIIEHTKHVRVPDTTTGPDAIGRQRYQHHYDPTGQLSLRIINHSSYFKTSWDDTEQTKMESLVPECVASMMKVAVEHRRNTAKKNQEEFFRKLRWEELRELKQQIDVEEARIQRLEKCAENWHRARRIREYVLAFVDWKTNQKKALRSDTALGKWAIWALQQADRIDPLAEKAPSVLDRRGELEGWSPYEWR